MLHIINFKFSRHKTVIIKLWRLMMISFLSLYLISPATAEVNTTQTACRVDIDQISIAQDPSKHTAPPDNLHWEIVDRLPDQWNTRWPYYYATAWYKIQWRYNCQPHLLQQPITLVIENITQNGKVFVNHDLLWQDLSMQEPVSRSQHHPRIWNIPASILHQGENTLWIQVNGSQTQKSGLGQVYLGDYALSYAQYTSWHLERRILPVTNAVIGFIVGVFYFMAWLALRKEQAFLWFILVEFSWALYSFFILYPDPILHLNSINIDRITHILFCVYVVSGCFAAWRFAHKSFAKIEIALYAFLIIACLSILLSPIAYLSQVIQICFNISVLIFLAKCLSYTIIAYQVRLLEVTFLALMYLFFVLVGIYDAISMMKIHAYPLSPYTALFSAMTIGLILAMKLARKTRQIEQFNKTLEDKVIAAKYELSTSLDQQHQLALENARLQERVYLSHDLHDGLGGSISRSIMLLEHNDQVEKAQSLAILRLLRSDLRQVLDYGSSIATKVPDHPIQWIAPIRHRFIQLFEELEIKSEWRVEPTWRTKPTAAQCLNLSRIAEEALTNILKHSQATQVSFSLEETEQCHLIMSIQDNGKGFDISLVSTSLHVGLQSMQARIQRLGGELKILSQPSSTLIQVNLDLAHKNTSSQYKTY